MAGNRDDMKKLLTQFVDELIDSEIGSVSDTVSRLEEQLSETVQEIRSDIERGLSDLRSELTKEITTMKNSVRQIEATVQEATSKMKLELESTAAVLKDEVDEKLVQSSYTVLDKITDFEKSSSDKLADIEKKSAQLSESIQSKVSEFETRFTQESEKNSRSLESKIESTSDTIVSRINSIEERVARNEKTMDMARDDHEKVKSVLSMFATSVANVTTSIPAVAPAPVAPVAVEPATPVVETKPQPVVEQEPIVEPEPVVEEIAEEAPVANAQESAFETVSSDVESTDSFFELETDIPVAQTETAIDLEDEIIQKVATRESQSAPVADSAFEDELTVEPIAEIQNSPVVNDVFQNNTVEQAPVQPLVEKEFEIDLSEVNFQATEKNPHMDVVVDDSGQHIYKPYM